MNKRVLLVGLAIVVPLIVLFAVSFGRETTKVRSPLLGRDAPPFELKVVDDERLVSLDQLKGKPAVVNFWATWCKPCQDEHRVLYQGARLYGERVQFVGIVYEDDTTKILDFLNRHGSGYPTLLDRGGKTAIAYGVYGVPETFFLDAEGRVVEKFMGPLSPDHLRMNVQRLLEGS